MRPARISGAIISIGGRGTGWKLSRQNRSPSSWGKKTTAVGGPISSPCPEGWPTARLARRRFQPSERWLSVLPPIASITGRKSRRNFKRSSPSHEPLALGEGEATLGRTVPNRLDRRLAKRVSSPAQTARLAELYVRLS